MTLELTPPAPWWVGTPLTLAATVTDDVGATLVAWQVDGETVAMDRTAPFAATWTPATPGPHIVQALAFDAGNNQAASAPVTVTALVDRRVYLPLVVSWK